MRAAKSAIAIALLLLSSGGCSSHRTYSGDHETVVQHAMEAIVLETNIDAKKIKRTEQTDSQGRKITKLVAPYTDYSSVHMRVLTDSVAAKEPKLDVRVTTHKQLHTRHKDWEQRILERVEKKLKKP